jgi:hypothetical protein
MEGGKTCPAGKIARKGYSATRRRTGILNKLLKRGTTYRVKATCVKDTGAPGHGVAVIGPLRKGDLKSVGYDATVRAATRHGALAKAVAKFGRLSTLRKLNAIATLTKRTAPSRSQTYKTDSNWVKKNA